MLNYHTYERTRSRFSRQNRRRNDNLEQQAQALYKSWFVDFEPFKDGEFIESEIGEIPAGWSIVKFGDIVEIPKKTINPQKFPDTIFNHYSQIGRASCRERV